MKKQLSEIKFLVYSTSAIIILLLTHVFQGQINRFYNPNNYIAIHTLLECFSISTSAVIVSYGLKNFEKTKSSQMLLLSFTFLVVGSLDLFHTLSFKGMPFLFTGSSVAKATWLWIVSRSLQAVLILLILLLPSRKVSRDYRTAVVAAAIFLAGAIVIGIFYYEKSLPLLMIDGKGTTALKNAIEYGITLIQFIALLITLYQYYVEKSRAKLAIALALVFLLLTELVFTIYQSVYDLDNFIGHLFKTIGFYYILYGFYFSHEDKDEHHEPIMELSYDQLPGLIFQAKRRKNEMLLTHFQGQLLEELGLNQETFSETNFEKISPVNKVILDQYCLMSLRLQEPISFEITCINRRLLVSIKPVSQAEILGAILDMTEAHQDKESAKFMENPIKLMKM